jgi:N-methylhydantoinase B/oxoprolinase/acetone carboxylase alpha subunit
VAAEQSLDSLAQIYGDSLVIVSYNYSMDTIGDQRRVFYQILTQDDPTVIFDGTDPVFEPNPNAYITTYTTHINAAKSITPSFNLNINAVASANTGNLQISILPADTFLHPSCQAFVEICQDSVSGFSKDFNYVARQIYSFPVNIVYPDSLDTTIVFTHSMPIDKMNGVLFIQDINTKKVLQAIKTKFAEEK